MLVPSKTASIQRMAPSGGRASKEAGEGQTEQRSQLVEDMKKLWNNPTFSDVVFNCLADGVQVHANRAILAARCAYFGGMLYGGMLEAGLSIISLPHTSSAALLPVLFYIYTGEMPEGAVLGAVGPSAGEERLQTLLEVYEAARKYAIFELMQWALEAVRESISAGNVKFVLGAAFELSAFDIEESAVTFCCQALSQDLDFFQDFPADILEHCLAHGAFGVPESDVLEAVISWGRHQSSAGLQCGEPSQSLGLVLQPLLQHVRLELVPVAILQQKLEAPGLLPQDCLLPAYCHQLLATQRMCVWRGGEGCAWDAGHIGSKIDIREDGVLKFRHDDHQTARSTVCFRSGRVEFEIQLDRVGGAYAWVGVATADSAANGWAGAGGSAWLFGDGGLIRHPGMDAASTQDLPFNSYCTVESRGSSFVCHHWGAKWGSDTSLKIRLDLERRECGLVVGGRDYGTAFRDLPQGVPLYFVASFKAERRDLPAKIRFLGLTQA